MFFSILSILITATAIFSFLNARNFKLPSTIGVLAISLIFSMLLMVAGKAGVPSVVSGARGFLSRIDFNQLLLHGLLAYLLFAGGLNLKIQHLANQKLAIGLLATLGVAISTVVVGGVIWLVLRLAHAPIPLVAAFLFGALISRRLMPTMRSRR